MTTKEIYDHALTIEHSQLAWRYALMISAEETGRLEMKRMFMEEAEKSVNKESEEAN